MSRLLLLLDVGGPDPVGVGLGVIILLLIIVMVLAVAFAGGLVFLLIWRKRRKTNVAEKPEAAPESA